MLPDGRLVSLPVPREGEPCCYGDLRLPGHQTYWDLARELGYPLGKRQPCHLDPDIHREVLHRATEWRPLFGQRKGEQSHLHKWGVVPGDLFLFFGWFRRTTRGLSHRLAFDSAAPHQHIVFGYLQVAEVITVGPGTELPAWISYHPHASARYRSYPNNTIYVARRRVSWDRRLAGPGGLRYCGPVVLTAEGQTRSRWKLPAALREACISRGSWADSYFQSPRRGQEFVITGSAAAELWAKSLIRKALPLARSEAK